jgi:hypothetical protein
MSAPTLRPDQLDAIARIESGISADFRRFLCPVRPDGAKRSSRPL